ncbi:MAG: UDP-N-acetylmuramoyl-L-alanyl-D-glutamate--2,6-diaminopimelate ligase [Zoogloeaceae bacterium]|jgi:UDP-N-acetylmuramyl-tripeptide synthetase|nr:UDP-N-acetylmuramoyl-L-alanyl-D-glutamate--2,6-diaminopimelate ligase [Zoogloeaceae bacterium]
MNATTLATTMSAREQARSLLRELAPRLARPLTGATDDSRLVRPGDLFLAYPGHADDGRRHIAAAIQNGAAAVLFERPANGGMDASAGQEAWAVPHCRVTNLRALVGPLAHEIAGRPSENLALLGVTGTNGKTTVSQWLARAHPEACAVIGTLGAGFVAQQEPTGLTTPTATMLARLLATFVDAGARAVALEASSIGIAEGRLDGAQVETAIFTNLTRDHLDYHRTMTAYAEAKAALFTWPGLRLAIVNLDDPFGRERLRATTATRRIGYTLAGNHDAAADVILSAEDLRSTAQGQIFRLATPRGGMRIETAVPGAYNVANLLAVAAVLYDLGLNVREIAERLALLEAPPGRMECLGGTNAPLVVVDYAHTPDALANALAALRPLTAARGGRLACVFGCGGGRDRGKRPLMGEIAAKNSDRIIVTSDNPRDETPQAILREIAAGLPEGVSALFEVDRAQAIGMALAEAEDADVILVAGKGHEATQEIAGKRLPFSDTQTSLAALAARHKKRSAA